LDEETIAITVIAMSVRASRRPSSLRLICVCGWVPWCAHTHTRIQTTTTDGSDSPASAHYWLKVLTVCLLRSSLLGEPSRLRIT
jgi:hypothetical protein